MTLEKHAKTALMAKLVGYSIDSPDIYRLLMRCGFTGNNEGSYHRRSWTGSGDKPATKFQLVY